MKKELVLIHGWDPRYYNYKLPGSSPENITWQHRKSLIELLSREFVLRYFNLPGFGGTPEPNEPAYEVEDFTQSFSKWMQRNGKDVAAIIGYSFGGVIALDYKSRIDLDIPTVLIAPALMRSQSWRSKLASRMKKLLPGAMTDKARDSYQRIFSTYYREGTSFIRNSYNLIVRRNMAGLLSKVDPKTTFLIYGTGDKSTPWDLVKDEVVKAKIKHHLISNGGHNIGHSHPNEISVQIKNFMNSVL
jgi:pimeloyl-ACP methyl ester carboxylesterase